MRRSTVTGRRFVHTFLGAGCSKAGVSYDSVDLTEKVTRATRRNRGGLCRHGSQERKSRDSLRKMSTPTILYIVRGKSAPRFIAD